MNDRAGVIKFLKSKISNKTRKESIQIVKNTIEEFNAYAKENSYATAERIFGFGFEKEAAMFLKKIEKDNSIAYDHDLNWFFNSDNIPNQTSVFETKEFLESKRKDVFESLYFFNLLFKQMDELKDNLDKPIDYLNSLITMPINEIQRHMLLGMILYWHGGYPVNNLNPKYNTILRLIEKEFTGMFPESLTPEKVFCKGNYERKVELKELENKLNNNIQVLVSGGEVFQIPFDFEKLPLYIHTEITNRFDQIVIKGTDNYENWKTDLKRFCLTLPDYLSEKVIKKGIEYGKMRYDFFLKHECFDKSASPYAESWERRLVLAETLLNEFEPVIKIENATIQISNFKLSQKVTKIDLIRVLNALYELRFVEDETGQIPTKETFMKKAGDFFGVDLVKYDVDLSQAFQITKIASNVEIFEKMKSKTSEIIQKKI